MDTLAETAWLLLTNPNISFLLLVIGVWSAALAILIPGTGLPETSAVISLALASVGLIQLPVNFIGLALIGLALVLIVAEFQFTAHGALLLGSGIAMAVGALFLFRAPADGRAEAQLSWVTVVGVPLVSLLVFGFILNKGLAAQRRPAMQDPRRLIGLTGIARTDVEREGVVYVNGELWTATAETKIPANTDVAVVDRKGLILKVAPLGAQPEAQPNGGANARS